MSLIPRDAITELKAASEVKSVATNALDDVELATIAARINEAANTGEFSVTYGQIIRPSTLSALKAKGYVVDYIGRADAVRLNKISWK